MRTWYELVCDVGLNKMAHDTLECLVGLAVAFPLVYMTTCGPNKKEFYDEDNTPAHLAPPPVAKALDFTSSLL